MANLLSNFERMVINNGRANPGINIAKPHPFAISETLYIAGVKISISREARRHYQIPNRCDETYPEDSGEPCTNTINSFDEIWACVGHPLLNCSEDLELKQE